MRGYVLPALLALWMGALLSCAGKPAPPAPAFPAPLRYTPPAEAENVAAYLAFPMDTGWKPWGKASVEYGGTIRMATSKRSDASGVARKVDFDAKTYNTISLKFRAANTSSCGVAWLGPAAGYSTRYDQPNVVRIPAATDGECREYRIELDKDGGAAWQGRIETLVFFPSDAATEAELFSVALSRAPRPSAPYISFGPASMETFRLPLIWKAAFPANGILDCHIAAAGQGPVTFRIASADTAGAAVLFEQRIQSKEPWTHVQVDLSTVASPPGAIGFSAQGVKDDVGLLGAPLVFVPGHDPGAIPVILISCDTVRADHCSSYGYARETTPNLDRFARESAALFTNAVSPAPSTLLGHSMMLTGRYPKNNGIEGVGNLSPEVQTLPEILRRQGYLTAGFTGHFWWLRPRCGFCKGFDLYDCAPEMLRPARETLPLVFGWLDSHPAANFFLFFHLYDAHQKTAYQGYRLPYDPGEDEDRCFSNGSAVEAFLAKSGRANLSAMNLTLAYRDKKIAFDDCDRDVLAALYDDGIHLVDDSVGQLLAWLKENGLFDKALIFVTADHGESLDERDYYGHREIYQPCVHIPLWVHFPGGRYAGTRCDSTVMLADILPTVMDVLDVKNPPPTDGVSLLRPLEGKETRQSGVYLNLTCWSGLRSEQWKLVGNSRYGTKELYDLVEDPKERQDVSSLYPDVVEAFSQATDAFFETKETPQPNAPTPAAPSDREREQLKALGYL